MSRFDYLFREVPVDPSILDALLIKSAVIRKTEDTRNNDIKKINKLREEAIKEIKILVETRLTPVQKQVVDLYFYKGKSQQEIAAIHAISQQVVSKHLFGASKNGKKIGGAINRLKKLCKEMNIDPEKWV